MITDLCGVDSVKAAILASPFYAWKVTEIKPIFSESGYLKTQSIFDASNADNAAEAAQRFEEFSEIILSGNPNNSKVYYLTLFQPLPGNAGRPKNVDPIVFSFTLLTPHTHSAFSFPAGGTQSKAAAQQAAPQAAPMQDYSVLLELERLKWENEQLRASILDDLESDDDDDESDDNDTPGNVFESFFSGVVNSPPDTQSPIQQSVARIITGFADSLTKNQANPQILAALEMIKAAAPDSEKLIIQLGEIAKTNPDQIKEFVNQLLTTFANGSDTKKPGE